MSQIITRSGRVIDVLNPRTEDIDIDDIAHALSNLCRWCGHSSSFYSVAQHSVLVSQYVPHEDALWGLLHDAAEAYLMDIPSPIKGLLPDYAQLEAKMQAAIVTNYGLSADCPASVTSVDLCLRATEAIELGLHPQMWDRLRVPPLAVLITPELPAAARDMFLERFWELTA